MERVLEIGGFRLVLDYVINDRWVDLSLWTGRSPNTLPTAFREPEQSVVRVSSLMAQIGDFTCDPRSGGIAGYKHICEYYGVGEQQFKRYIAPQLEYLRWLGDIPVTHVSSAAADGLRYRDEVDAKRRRNLPQFAN